MSYEGKMFEDFGMPAREEVEQTLLKTLFEHNGSIKEFGSGEEIVDEIAGEFNLTVAQRTAFLETIYRKENRLKKSLLWHRLLFRAADSLAKKHLVSRPTDTFQITNKKEWMLTEDGFDEALHLLNIPSSQKELLPTKSFEVQKVVKKIMETPKPDDYNPFEKEKKVLKITKESSLRARGFRHAVIEAYDHRCAFCGMKINSPDSLTWEVEAAHIVPHSLMGKDDIWNGLALCRLHHWAFDVGWLALQDDFKIQVSSKIDSLPIGQGRMGDYEFIRGFSAKSHRIHLPEKDSMHPHRTAISWHRENRFYR